MTPAAQMSHTPEIPDGPYFMIIAPQFLFGLAIGLILGAYLGMFLNLLSS